MKSIRRLAAALLLGGSALLRAQSTVPPLLYAQTTPVTVANSANYDLISSGDFYGVKSVAYASVGIGHTIRMHAAGVISTAPGAQLVLPFIDTGFGAAQLMSGFVAIPGGLSNALFELDVTLTVSDKTPPFWFGAYGSCKMCVDGATYAAPFPDRTLPTTARFGNPVAQEINWRWGWRTQSPANSLTVTSLVTEWLR